MFDTKVIDTDSALSIVKIGPYEFGIVRAKNFVQYDCGIDGERVGVLMCSASLGSKLEAVRYTEEDTL